MHQLSSHAPSDQESKLVINVVIHGAFTTAPSLPGCNSSRVDVHGCLDETRGAGLESKSGLNRRSVRCNGNGERPLSNYDPASAPALLVAKYWKNGSRSSKVEQVKKTLLDFRKKVSNAITDRPG